MADSQSTDNIVTPELSETVNGTRRAHEDVDTGDSGTFQTRFGYLRCRPDCLQFLTSARWFLLFACLSCFFQSMIVNGLVGVTISTIERRFALASSQTAWILASYEIAGVPALLVVGYFGSILRRPVWIGAGLIVLGIGLGMYSIPHFAAPPYRYSGDSINLCVERAWNRSSENASLPPNNRCADDGVEGGSQYLAAFILSMVFIGFGAVPMYVLGVTYLDDASPHGTASVHIGIFFSISALGPVVAFVGGGFLLKLYTHFDTVDTSTITLQQNDPRWVGAWWVGFLAAMVPILLIAPVFFGYPPDPSTKHHRDKSASNQPSDFELDHEPTLDLRAEGLDGLVKTSKSLITNGPFVFTMLYGTFDALLVNGFIAFGAKYFQQQFGLTASMAGIVFGIVAVPGSAGGFLLGSIIIKRMSLSSGQQLRAMFFLALVCLATLTMFCVQCDTAPLAGGSSYHNVPPADTNGDATSQNTCSLNCSCEVEWFEPVCGSDGLTYFSPCYAGCHNFLADSGYGNCSCIGDVSTNTSDVSSTAAEGVCDVTSCQIWRLVVFFILLFLAMIIIFVCEIFHVSSLLRVVEHSERPLAYAIDWLLQRVGGGLPGPILFGFALDHSCLLWEKKCDGSTGACLYYDNHHMAWLLLAVCASCKLLNTVSGLIAWRLYVRKHRKDDDTQTADEFMLSSVAQNVDGGSAANYGSTENVVDSQETDDALATSNAALEVASNNVQR